MAKTNCIYKIEKMYNEMTNSRKSSTIKTPKLIKHALKMDLKYYMTLGIVYIGRSLLEQLT